VFKFQGRRKQRMPTSRIFMAHTWQTTWEALRQPKLMHKKKQNFPFYAMTRVLQRKNLRAYLLGNMAALLQRVMLLGMLGILLGGGTWYLFHGKATVENMAYLVFAYTISNRIFVN